MLSDIGEALRLIGIARSSHMAPGFAECPMVKREQDVESDSSNSLVALSSVSARPIWGPAKRPHPHISSNLVGD
jgi:hypothetical protein